jgi:23S rRNA (cytosine1962-C5)-methyltransferase
MGGRKVLLIADNWSDYELLMTGDGDKLERWGEIYLRRPDPQIIWPATTDFEDCVKPHAVYYRSKKGGGEWKYFKKIPESWIVRYGDFVFKIQPTGFKHTGLFPEQAVNWNWMINKIHQAERSIRVLNLFAYTGGATVACASAGAEVCHVDASKGMIKWAKENMALSQLQDQKVRYMADDVPKFVKREQRRGQKYDAIIMDPPSYGRGPKNELWKIEDELFPLINECMKLLVEKPLFVLVNSYTTGFSHRVIHNILEMTVQNQVEGRLYSGEIGLRNSLDGLVLPCGIYGRWESKDE